jgi:hypothetical protein
MSRLHKASSWVARATLGRKRRMGRIHEREHQVIADAVSRGSRARLLLHVHIAGEHELDCTEHDDLPALQVLHDKCHADGPAGGRSW